MKRENIIKELSKYIPIDLWRIVLTLDTNILVGLLAYCQHSEKEKERNVIDLIQGVKNGEPIKNLMKL